jgi:phage tail sheath protein FI
VGLEPSVPDERRADLLESQVNLLRQDPRGFVASTADTLSDDPSVRPLHVRRLLMLLRRLAHRNGAEFVFEPNSDAFQRSVQHGFEALLEILFARGAFAGATSREAFQVVASRSTDGSRISDGERLVVDLRVAPAQPMTFLTVRLVQTGGATQVTEGR